MNKKLKFLTSSVIAIMECWELNSSLKIFTKKIISEDATHLQVGGHQLCPRIAKLRCWQLDQLLPSHRSMPPHQAPYFYSPVKKWNLWHFLLKGMARVNCLPGVKYFLGGRRSGKVEGVNKAQSHWFWVRTQGHHLSIRWEMKILLKYSREPSLRSSPHF